MVKSHHQTYVSAKFAFLKRVTIQCFMFSSVALRLLNMNVRNIKLDEGSQGNIGWVLTNEKLKQLFNPKDKQTSNLRR